MAVARNNRFFAGCIALLLVSAAEAISNETADAEPTTAENDTRPDGKCSVLTLGMTGGCGDEKNTNAACPGDQWTCNKSFCCEPYPTCGSFECTGTKVPKGEGESCNGDKGCDKDVCCKEFESKKSTLSAPATAGDTKISVADISQFKEGDSIKLSADENTTESKTIIAIDTGRRLWSYIRRLAGGELTLDSPLETNFTGGVEVQTVLPTPAPTSAPAPASSPEPAPAGSPAPAPVPATTAAPAGDEKSSSSVGSSGSSSFGSLPSGKSSSSGSLTSGSGTAWMWVALFIGLICCIGGLIAAILAPKGKKTRSSKKKKPTKTTEPAVVYLPEAAPLIVSEPLMAPTVYTTQVAAPVVYEYAAPQYTYAQPTPQYTYAQPTPAYTYTQPSVL